MLGLFNLYAMPPFGSQWRVLSSVAHPAQYADVVCVSWQDLLKTRCWTCFLQNDDEKEMMPIGHPAIVLCKCWMTMRVFLFFFLAGNPNSFMIRILTFVYGFCTTKICLCTKYKHILIQIIEYSIECHIQKHSAVYIGR